MNLKSGICEPTRDHLLRDCVHADSHRPHENGRVSVSESGNERDLLSLREPPEDHISI